MYFGLLMNLEIDDLAKTNLEFILLIVPCYKTRKDNKILYLIMKSANLIQQRYKLKNE